MTSDVVLTAALRNNLLSLQNTQSLIDTTQFRLATGRKVSSALDGPQAFFASQALNNRASDLTRLLDGIGQSIQVIKAADNGVTALTTLVEQADSIAANAKDALASGQVEAKVVGNRDLRGIDDLTDLTGVTDAGTDVLTFSVTDENGVARNIGAYSTAANSATATSNVTIAGNLSSEELVAAINNIHLEATSASAIADGEQAFFAELDEGGNLSITALNGYNYRLQFATVAATDVADLALAADLGFGGIARTVADSSANANSNFVEFSAIADVALTSFALYDVTTTPDTLADGSDLLSNIVDENGIALFANINAVADDYSIGVNGATAVPIELFSNNGAATVTIQDFVDDINNNTNLNTLIRAEFDTTTGQITIRAIDSSVESIEIGLATGSTATANFGFGVNANISTANAANGELESIRLSAAAGTLAQLESDYNRVRDQITELVTNGDTAYRGTNLLNGDDLLTNFNELRTSSLTSFGVTFTADGLGLGTANFARSATVDGALDDTLAALETIRSFGSTLANDLTIIQTRQAFTQSTINVLTEGADKLTIADQNEEGAKLLALQTRQQLGVTSLALASQSQQSILRLF